MLDLDAAEVPGHGQSMFEALATEPPGSTSDEAERQRIVESLEGSLANLDARRGVPHSEVLAMIDARHSGSK